MRRPTLALALLLLVGCEADAPDLAIDLRTDFAPLSEFVRVRTQRVGDRGEILDERSILAQLDGDYLRGVRVAELRDLPRGTHTIRVSLLDLDGAVILSHSLTVDLVQSRVVTALISRSCLDVVCPPVDEPLSTECAGGVCVDPGCTPETPERCPIEEGCASDADCMATIGCAVGRCIDSACLSVDEGACGEGMWCHPTLGCQMLMLPDTGPPEMDAGPSCVPRTCEALGYECGTPTECGAPLDCGGCVAPAICGGGGEAFRCGITDSTAPTVTITSAPVDPSNDATPSFSFRGDDGAGTGISFFECRIDGGAWSRCASPESYGALADGDHTFSVRATDGAGNRSVAASHAWTVDTTPPVVTIAAIVDPQPTSYSAAPSVSWTFTCSDATTACVSGSRTCTIDGNPASITCNWLSGSATVGATGPYAFGDHGLTINVADEAGNVRSATRTFTVSRCARDLQYPNRTSNGLTRGGCCAGLVASNWQDFTGPWHPRGDGSCRPMSDFTSREYETIWGGGGCEGTNQTTTAWLQDMGMVGCTSAAGRSACVRSQVQARIYCGTNPDSGSGQTPFHGRAGEGWHGAVAAGCETGVMSTSSLMQRYGADRVCFNTIDLASDRGSIPSSESCAAGLTRYCRSNPVDSAVACVCTSTGDPYASDGRN